jgi:muramoyltetrapeptide carboxypeptidase LdcA involved in peptidoglycan recycling
VRGIVIGRFQKASQMTTEKLSHIISTKVELSSLPVLANVNFGHTYPQITFPIGGRVRMHVGNSGAMIEIVKH